MSDILDTIDATVDGLCACGCGRLLESGGPSGWWATQECQRRFQERTATDPGEVYARLDAAPYPPDDSAEVALSPDGDPASVVAAIFDVPVRFLVDPSMMLTDPARVRDLRGLFRSLGLTLERWQAELLDRLIERLIEGTGPPEPRGIATAVPGPIAGYSPDMVIVDEVHEWLDADPARAPGRLWAQWLASERIAASVQQPTSDLLRITNTGA